jgi:hypothetical protein
MRFMVAIFCLLGCGTSALAQYGVSNSRDAFGNVIRDAGTNRGRGVNQGSVNNGPINNAPTQPPPTNPRMNRGTSR